MTIGGCEKRDCPAFDKCTAQYRGSRCAALRYSYGLDDPKTNYDRLISKTPEELAVWINNNSCLCAPGKEPCEDGECEECWLDWLRQEVEEKM